MITVQLTNATNGIIKKVIDTQYNGVDSTVELTTLYEFNEEDRLEYFNKNKHLFEDLCDDLGLELGSDYDPITLRFNIDWGDKYIPTQEEINQKIKYLKSEIRNLQKLKKEISILSGNDQ